MTQNNAHYAIQGHSMSPVSVTVSDVLCVSNSHTYWHRIWDMADYWSNCRFWQGLLLFNALVGWTPKFGIEKFIVKKL